MDNKKVRFLADLSLVFVTLIWGATFVTVQEAIKKVEPYYFLSIRFGLAAVIMTVLANKRITKINRSDLAKGVIIGLVLFFGYAFQTVGLKYTTASNAGFITGLAVVMVPVFSLLVTQKVPGFTSSAGIVSAMIGLALLTINQNLTFNLGDLLVFFCAVSFTAHILLVGKFSPASDPFILNTIQIATVAVVSFGSAVVKETAPSGASFTPDVWWAIIITAVLATALAFFIQTWVQKFSSPTHTAIIFTMEPVFAALFAFFFAGEFFTLKQGLGALLILTGMIASELSGPGEAPAAGIERRYS